MQKPGFASKPGLFNKEEKSQYSWNRESKKQNVLRERRKCKSKVALFAMTWSLNGIVSAIGRHGKIFTRRCAI